MKPTGEVHFYLGADCKDPVFKRILIQGSLNQPPRERREFGNRKAHVGQRAICIVLLLVKYRLTGSAEGNILIERSDLTETWVSLLASSFSKNELPKWFKEFTDFLGWNPIKAERGRQRGKASSPAVFYRAVADATSSTSAKPAITFPVEKLRFFRSVKSGFEEITGASLLEIACQLERDYWENTILSGLSKRTSKSEREGKSSEQNTEKGDFTRPSLPTAPAKLTHVTLSAARSTNAISQQMISDGHSTPFLVHAWNQTHGKGKLGRVWQGGPGVLTATWNYAFSKAHSTPEILGVLGVVTALAVRDAVCALNDALKSVQVKWPNDVLIDGKKVAGILIELMSDTTSRIASIGIGVNVCRIPILIDGDAYTLPPASIFNDYDDDASRERRIENALSVITESLEKRVTRLLNEGGLARQKADFERYDYSLDKEVVLLSSGGKQIARGVNRGINSQGQLTIEYPGGRRKDYHSGEVTTIRTAMGLDVDAPEPPPELTLALDAEGDTFVVIKSPMIGTFYNSDSPCTPPFVAIGAHVNVGQNVCVIEAMKMMNLISSDHSGIVSEIFVANAQPVEFGTPLFKIRLDASATHHLIPTQS